MTPAPAHNSSLVNVSWSRINTSRRVQFAKVDQLYAFPQWQSKGLFEMARSFAQENQINEAKTVYNETHRKIS